MKNLIPVLLIHTRRIKRCVTFHNYCGKRIFHILIYQMWRVTWPKTGRGMVLSNFQLGKYHFLTQLPLPAHTLNRLKLKCIARTIVELRKGSRYPNFHACTYNNYYLFAVWWFLIFKPNVRWDRRLRLKFISFPKNGLKFENKKQ